MYKFFKKYYFWERFRRKYGWRGGEESELSVQNQNEFVDCPKDYRVIKEKC